jgi:hypothetical protein
MAFVAIQYLAANTASFTSPSATAITTDSGTTALLLSLLGASGNFTTISITDGINSEIMFIEGVSAGAVNVLRGQEGTTPVALAQGAAFRFAWTETSILAIAPGGTVTCNGSGATIVTGGPAYTIHSDPTVITPGAGINVSGTYPNYNISSTVPSGPPGPTGAAGPAVLVTASGISTASGGPSVYNVDTTAPNLIAGSGIGISGTYPNLTITNTQTPGGTGTVTSVTGGTGITITGSSTITPTISLTATGVTAGAYGAISINAAGQITAISNGFLTSLSTSTTGVTAANPSAGVYTINIAAASTGSQGLTAYAPATSSGSNNAGNNAQSVTPAGINAVIAALNLSPATLGVSGSQTALSAGSYTNLIGSMPIAVNIAAGEFAIIDIYVEVWDPSNPTTIQSFGIGLFNGASLVAGNSPIPSCTRNLKYLVTGPLVATLTVSTTAFTGTMALGSYSASVVSN